VQQRRKQMHAGESLGCETVAFSRLVPHGGVRGCRHAGTLFYHRAKREADFLREMTQESQPGSSNDKKAEHRIAFGQRFAILPTDLMI
jgi:hypothetical protein